MIQHKTKDIFASIRVAGNKRVIAILNLLSQQHELNYVMINKSLFGFDGRNTILAYYLRVMVKNQLLDHHKFKSSYTLSRRGKMILKFIRANEEKFISETSKLVCRGSSTNKHDTIKICKNCGFQVND